MTRELNDCLTSCHLSDINVVGYIMFTGHLWSRNVSIMFMYNSLVQLLV